VKGLKRLILEDVMMLVLIMIGMTVGWSLIGKGLRK